MLNKLCFNNCIDYNILLSNQANFMVVDCGGGTVDLTVHELLELEDYDQLIEITGRTGGYCGSCYIDQAFIKYRWYHRRICH